MLETLDDDGRESSRGLLDWMDSSRGLLDWMESSRGLLDWMESSRGLLDWMNSSRELLDWMDSSRGLLDLYRLTAFRIQPCSLSSGLMSFVLSFSGLLSSGLVSLNSAAPTC